MRHVIADLFLRDSIQDPELDCRLITVPEVRMSPDLRLATVYVMPLGAAPNPKLVKQLEKHRKFVRSEVTARVNLKFSPDIRFRHDERFAEVERIDRLLRSESVVRDLSHDHDHEHEQDQ